MPSLRKPYFSFDYQVAHEIDALREHKRHREIPDKKDNHLLLGTWNIANLGLHKREERDYQVLAYAVALGTAFAADAPKIDEFPLLWPGMVALLGISHPG